MALGTFHILPGEKEMVGRWDLGVFDLGDSWLGRCEPICRVPKAMGKGSFSLCSALVFTFNLLFLFKKFK